MLYLLFIFFHLVQGGPCDNAVIFVSTWPGGMGRNLVIPVTSTVTSWTIDITFSAAITSLQVWNVGSSISSDNIRFRLTNAFYNGDQTAGSVLNGTVGFNAYFPISNTAPTITAILFNGVNICSGTNPASTTSTPKTTTTTNRPASSTTISTSKTVSTTKSPSSTTTIKPLVTKYNYTEVITKSLLFYYVQRSGRLPANDNPIPYRWDSALTDAGQNGEDLTGGYYDAADFVKFGFPMACATTMVAWSVMDYPLGYSSAGQLDNARKMIKWATDYFIKAHVSPNQLYGQVGDGNVDHSYWGRPEQMTMARPSFYISTTKPGSDLAGETAAALAAASVVFSGVNATYSSLCLTHAIQLYNFAKQYKGIYSSSIPGAASFYSSSGFGDELAWAAVWLYRSTGNVAYLNDAKSFYSTYGLSQVGSGAFSWDDKTAGVQVMLAKLDPSSSGAADIRVFCDAKVAQTKSAKGLLFISQWGSLRYASNVAFICLQAADLKINPTAYRQLAQRQIHYALGDTGRSFVTGFGVNPPVRIHHRSSSCPNMPATCDWNTFNNPGPNYQTIYGGLVGGPTDMSDSYSDDRGNYVGNELACDYNAGFQGAVAALQSLAIQGIFK